MRRTFENSLVGRGALLSFSFFLGVSLSNPLAALAQEPAGTVEEALAAEEAAAEGSEGAQGPSQAASEGNVTIDFKDADIQNVLRILSYKSGVNIVAGKDVTGVVTMRLVNVPWEKALDMVLKTYGYAYERDGNIIRVTTIESLKKEDLSTEVFTLNYTRADEAEKSIKDVLSDRGKIQADIRSNSLVVTDMATVLQQVRKVVERLDKITPQVAIESKIIEMSLGDSERLGIKWNAQVALTGSARPTTFPFPAKQRTVFHKFYPPGRDTQSSASSIGTSGTTTTTAVQDFPSVIQPTFPVADKKEFAFGTLDFSKFQVLLELINQRKDAKVLSEPHVTTLNNQEAKILVGEVLSIPLFERNSTTGRMEITGYKDRDVGISLLVTPHINDAGDIVVDVHPNLTNFLGFEDLTPEIKAPKFDTREASTQVRIKTGQTIVIGGLIREDKVDTKTKVPFLGDVPLLGHIFTHHDKAVKKTDLLFFVTVNILSEKSPLPQSHRAASIT
ncbi:MAG: secretin and TonB N-terminal domain-containing protein [Candidatus Omnitrophica bacterium]|nr:secretin and TonB N-terminal domain-containing protein [Candidatus Omnitrophota bacterium]